MLLSAPLRDIGPVIEIWCPLKTGTFHGSRMRWGLCWPLACRFYLPWLVEMATFFSISLTVPFHFDDILTSVSQ